MSPLLLTHLKPKMFFPMVLYLNVYISICKLYIMTFTTLNQFHNWVPSRVLFAIVCCDSFWQLSQYHNKMFFVNLDKPTQFCCDSPESNHLKVKFNICSHKFLSLYYFSLVEPLLTEMNLLTIIMLDDYEMNLLTIMCWTHVWRICCWTHCYIYAIHMLLCELAHS